MVHEDQQRADLPGVALLRAALPVCWVFEHRNQATFWEPTVPQHCPLLYEACRQRLCADLVSSSTAGAACNFEQLSKQALPVCCTPMLEPPHCHSSRAMLGAGDGA